MKLFKRKSDRAAPMLIPSQHSQFTGFELPETVEPFEKELFDKLRYTVPVIDAAIMKIIRLTGGFRLICSDERYQEELDNFCENVPVGIKGKSLGTFIDCFLCVNYCTIIVLSALNVLTLFIAIFRREQ